MTISEQIKAMVAGDVITVAGKPVACVKTGKSVSIDGAKAQPVFMAVAMLEKALKAAEPEQAGSDDAESDDAEHDTDMGAVDVAAEQAVIDAQNAALTALPEGGALITEPALLAHPEYLILTAGMLDASMTEINAGKPVACMVRLGKHFQPALLTGSSVIYDKALECDCVHAQAEIAGNYTGKGKIDGNLVSHKITRRTIAVSKAQGEALKALQPKTVKADKPAVVKAGKAGSEAGKAEKAVVSAEQARMKALTDLLTAGAAAGLSKAEIMTLAGLPAPAEQAPQIIIATR